MKTKTVEIISRADGQRLKARLFFCPDCDGQMFFMYMPEGSNHPHYQCSGCGTTYCAQGCHKGDSLTKPK